MLISLRLPDVGLELGADLVEQLVQTAGAAVGRGDTPHASMARIHGHGCRLVGLFDPSREVPRKGRRARGAVRSRQLAMPEGRTVMGINGTNRWM